MAKKGSTTKPKRGTVNARKGKLRRKASANATVGRKSRRQNNLAGKLKPSVKPMPLLLPLLDSNFNWDRFEAFCLHLVGLLPQTRSCNRYGKQGDTQDGIDIEVKTTAGQTESWQCKNVNSFTGFDLKEAIAANKYKASRHTLVVTCTVTASVRSELKKHSKWRLWDEQDISRQVRKLPVENATRLVAAHFGPQWAQDFVGHKAIATFVSPGIYFDRWMKRNSIFSHVFALVGRKDEVTSLRAFVDSKDLDTLILPGSGGSGKSRLLVEFCKKFGRRHPLWQLRLVTEGLCVNAESAAELPIGDWVIIVDDAHRRDDLSAIFAVANQRPGNTKVILVTRTYGLSRIRGQVAWAGTNRSRELAPLKRLDRKEIAALAGKVLGAKFSRYAESLAAATPDSPLVTAVAAYLLRTEQVPPALLANHEEFRRKILDRFGDESAARFLEGEDRELCRRMLPVVAAVQPIALSDSNLRHFIATFLHVDELRVASMLGALQEHGILDQPGDRARIVPDVLADYLLSRACITASGQSTGFAITVFRAFQGRFRPNVVQNLSELDWRERHSAVDTPDVLQAMWQEIRDEFEQASDYDREHLLRQLEPVSFLQARKVLELVSLAVEAPSSIPARENAIRVSRNRSDRERLLSAVPKILEGIAYAPECTRKACDILWDLAKNDTVSGNNSIRAPIKVLETIAEVKPDKSLDMLQTICSAVEDWMKESGVEKFANSPLKLLDQLLAKTGVSTSSHSGEIKMTGFALDRASYGDLRERAFALLRASLARPEIRIVLDAVKILERQLSGVSGPLGQPLPEGFHQQWEGEQSEAFEMLARLAQSDAHPLVRIELEGFFRALSNARVFTESSPDNAGSRQAKQSIKVLSGMQKSCEFELFRSLLASDALNEVEQSDVQASNDLQMQVQLAQRRIDSRHEKVAAAFVKEYPYAPEGLTRLKELLAEIQSYKVEPNPYGFLIALRTTDSAWTEILCAEAVKQDIPYVVASLPGILGFAQQGMSSTEFELALSAASSPSDIARAAAARYFGFAVPKDPTGSSLRALKVLARDPVVRVRWAAAGALGPV